MTENDVSDQAQALRMDPKTPATPAQMAQTGGGLLCFRCLSETQGCLFLKEPPESLVK